MKKSLRAILCFSIFCFFLNKSIAQSGTLDSSFGTNGKTSVCVGYEDWGGAREMALQPDGKLVTVGNTPIDWVNPDSLLLVRFLANGQLDPGFGVNGRVTTAFNYGASIYTGGSVVIQADGKIIAGGGYFKGGAMSDNFVLVRYLPNGSIDSSFGTNGVVFTNPRFAENVVSKLCLQKDGKILAGGYSDGFALIRYNANGTIDSTFATNGIYIVPGGGDPRDIVVQQDNKILTVSTQYEESDPGFKAQLRRFLPGGTPDPSFGINGVVESDFSAGYESGESMVLTSDGNIVVNGVVFNPGADTGKMFLSRYKTNGSLDSSFGNKGIVMSNVAVFNEDKERKLLQQFNGKLIAMGARNDNNLSVYRFNANGKTDLTFGNGGKATADFGTTMQPTSAVLQRDGNIAVVGKPCVSIARFKGDEPVIVNIQRDISVTEGNTGTRPANFTIVLSKPYTSDVSVHYTTKNKSAKAGTDYVAASGTLKIKAGTTTGTITVQVKGDTLVEANEKFNLVLSRPANALLGALDSASCTIINDDQNSGLQSMPVAAIENENQLSISPNPAKAFVTIKGLREGYRSVIYIIDMDGKVTLTNTTSSSVYQQNVEHLAAGIYQVLITCGNQRQTIKFVKQ